jgi:uncharacterized protein
MSNPAVPISACLIGTHALLALVLSYQVALARTQTRVWHGSTRQEALCQPDYLAQPNGWAGFVERQTVAQFTPSGLEDDRLQRTVRAHGNLMEYLPLGLLLILVLELMQAPASLLWSLGGLLLVARLAHAWGVIQTYGPSVGRAIGFFGTSLMYLVGSGFCLYIGVMHLGMR